MISIIIPTYNEQDTIASLVKYLLENSSKAAIEIIISDGGSTDLTLAEVQQAGAVAIVSPRKGRAAQMNYGASIARGDVLYFLHADSIPPANFIAEISEKINVGYVGGCYRLRFDDDHWFLKANAWFTRFNVNAVRFGDQSLFVRKAIFETIGGFKEEFIIMEDQEIIHRIRGKGKFVVIADYVTTSARKYRLNGVYRMQAIFFYIYFAYVFGASQQKLLRIYKKLIRSS